MLRLLRFQDAPYPELGKPFLDEADKVAPGRGEAEQVQVGVAVSGSVFHSWVSNTCR